MESWGICERSVEFFRNVRIRRYVSYVGREEYVNWYLLLFRVREKFGIVNIGSKLYL